MKLESTKDLFVNQIKYKSGDQTRDQVWVQVWGKVNSQDWDKIRVQIVDQVWSKIYLGVLHEIRKY